MRSTTDTSLTHETKKRQHAHGTHHRWATAVAIAGTGLAIVLVLAAASEWMSVSSTGAAIQASGERAREQSRRPEQITRTPSALGVIALPENSASNSDAAPTAAHLKGQVLSETGEPVTGAYVGTSCESAPVVTTDEQGRFEIPLPDNDPVAVFATSPDHAPYRQRSIMPDGQEITLVLEQPGVVEGATAVELEDALVSVCRERDDPPGELCIARSVVDKSGLFRFEKIPSGDYDLVLSRGDDEIVRRSIRVATADSLYVDWTSVAAPH